MGCYLNALSLQQSVVKFLFQLAFLMASQCNLLCKRGDSGTEHLSFIILHVTQHVHIYLGTSEWLQQVL